MPYTASKVWEPLLIFVELAGSAFLLGCGDTTRTIWPAKSAILYCDNNSVWFVADGSLPAQVPGYTCSVRHGDRTDTREFRLASRDVALRMLRRWAVHSTIRFALMPGTVEDLQNDKLGEGSDVVMEQLTDFARSLSHETRNIYIVLIVPPAELKKWHSDLMAHGLQDDTMRFFQRIEHGLGGVSSLFKSRPH